MTDATASIVSQDQLIKQIQFPKIVLPVAATTAGIVSFAFGTVALGLLMLFFSDRISTVAAVHPGHRRRPVRVHARPARFLVAAGNVFFRDLGNVVGHVLRLWWFLSPGLYSLASLDDIKIFKEHPFLTTLAERESRSRSCSRPIARSSTGPPTRRRQRPAEHGAAGDPARRRARSSWRFTTMVFKRLEPNFAKVI